MPENQRINEPAVLHTANLAKPVITMKHGNLNLNEQLKADFSKAYLTYHNRNSGHTSFPMTGNVPWVQQWTPELLKLHEKDGKATVFLDGEIVFQGGVYVFVATRVLLGF